MNFREQFLCFSRLIVFLILFWSLDCFNVLFVFLEFLKGSSKKEKLLDKKVKFLFFLKERQFRKDQRFFKRLNKVKDFFSSSLLLLFLLLFNGLGLFLLFLLFFLSGFSSDSSSSFFLLLDEEVRKLFLFLVIFMNFFF